MLKPDYKHFLSILANKEEHTSPTLFAPFVSDILCEQLIWRRGKQLWDTPAHYAETMITLRERTRSDVVILDSRRFPDDSLPEMLSYAASHLPDGSAVVLLCQTKRAQAMAENEMCVCAIGGYGKECAPMNKPFIRMDKKPDYAVAEGAAAWFAPGKAAQYYDAYHDRLAIAGGLGADFIAESAPLDIHNAAIAMLEKTKNRGYLLGSGGEIPADSYLSLISLLGIYGRMH